MADRPALQKLRDNSVQWLRIHWCDFGSILRCHVIPVREVLNRLDNRQAITVTITKAALALSPHDDPIPGAAQVGSYNLVPVWSSLRFGPIPGHLSCLGEFKEKPDSTPIHLCPRTVLRTTLDRARQQELEIQLKFELEFAVMKQNPDTESAEHHIAVRNDGHGWSTARGLSNWGRKGSFNSILDEVKSRLERGGVSVERLHVKFGPGQYSITLGELEALQACDTYLLARHFIESTAAEHGFRVTMHPKPFPGFPNNAVHVRISVDPPGSRNSFFAGILDHLPALTAFTNASPVSYTSEGESHWMKPCWVGWGTENYTTPLCKSDEDYWEFRLLDGLANPYLALAAILSAGANGVADRTALSWTDCTGDLAHLPAASRQGFGITEEVPNELTAALEGLNEDQRLVALMPNGVVQRYIEVKRRDITGLPGEPNQR